MDRSAIMSRIRSSDTKPEKRLRRILWQNGRRFRKHYPVAGLRVDIAFTRAKVAVMVDGCFWHGCPAHYRRPKERQNYWDAKLKRNLARDKRDDESLRRAGWHVVRIWEHESPDCAFGLVASALENSDTRRPSTKPASGH